MVCGCLHKQYPADRNQPAEYVFKERRAGKAMVDRPLQELCRQHHRYDLRTSSERSAYSLRVASAPRFSVRSFIMTKNTGTRIST